jgi:nitroimidazol reductase NimA-like FMN-containing flavoprotein (pyridoxamine 5'-phosphate oxidase superfamily)
MSYAPPDKIGKLNDAEILTFLAEPWNARIATTTPEGWPYITPIWYHYETDRRTFVVVGRENAEWVGYVRLNPKVALLVADDLHAEHTRVNVRGLAEVVDGPIAPADHPELAALVELMALHYLGPSGSDYANLTAHRRRIVIRIAPRHWRSWTGREWHHRYL